MLNVHDALESFILAKTGEVEEATISWYRSLLTPMAEYLGERVDDIADVDITLLRRWRAHLINREEKYADHPYRGKTFGGLRVTTLHDKVIACRIFFSWLSRERIIEHNPSERLKPPSLPKHKEPKAISDGDIRKLLRAAYRRRNLRDAAIIFVLADTGARVAGVAGLRIKDLDLASGTLLVTEKGNKTRPVYLTQPGIKAVREYLRIRPDVDHDYVWVSLKKSPLTESGIYQVLQRLGEVTGVEVFNPHAFRHAHARENLRYGVSLERVSKLLGHEDVSTTANCYAIWTKSELHETHRQAAARRNLWDKIRD